MPDDDDYLGLGNQELRWPTPVESSPEPEQPMESQPQPGTHREAVPDLLEQEIQRARATGGYVPGLGPAAPPQVAAFVDPQPVQPAAAAMPPVPVTASIDTRLFLSVLTIPDHERLGTFDLPPLPAQYTTTPMEKLPDPIKLAEEHRAQKTLLPQLEEMQPCVEWLQVFAETEARGKNRAAILGWVQARITSILDVDRLVGRRITQLASVPEFCAIAAVAFSFGDGQIRSIVVGQAQAKGDKVTERMILEFLWSQFSNFSHVVSWSGIEHLLLTRSILCGIHRRAVKLFNPESLVECVVGSEELGPYTIDDVCKLYGVESQLDPITGGVVELNDAWLQGHHLAVAKSAEVQLSKVRRLWQVWEGFHVG